MKEGRESREVYAHRKGHRKDAAICTQRREASSETSCSISTLLGLQGPQNIKGSKSLLLRSPSLCSPAGGRELSNKYSTKLWQPHSDFPCRLGHVIHFWPLRQAGKHSKDFKRKKKKTNHDVRVREAADTSLLGGNCRTEGQTEVAWPRMPCC